MSNPDAMKDDLLTPEEQDLVIGGDEVNELNYLESKSRDTSLDSVEIDKMLRLIPALCATVRALREETLKGICVYCGEIQQYKSLQQKSSEEGNQLRVEHIKQCPERPELKLIAELKRLMDWKESALPLLNRYENLAETFGGKLGSLRVENLERGVTALREQLAHWQERTRTRTVEVEQLQAQLAQVEEARDQLSTALSVRDAQLAQVTQERDRLREQLTEEISKRVNNNVERMEQSQKVTQAELERHCSDDRLSDTQRGSYQD